MVDAGYPDSDHIISFVRKVSLTPKFYLYLSPHTNLVEVEKVCFTDKKFSDFIWETLCNVPKSRVKSRFSYNFAAWELFHSKPLQIEFSMIDI